MVGLKNGVLINLRHACAARVTVVGSVCVCLCVLTPKLTSRMFICAKIDTAYLMGDAVQIICGNFTINASFKSYSVICLPTASYSGIAAAFCTIFRWQSFLKLTQCKAVSFFLFSIRILPTNLPSSLLPTNVPYTFH